MSELQEGMPAPDFCLPDADERTVCLAGCHGRLLLSRIPSGCTLQVVLLR